MVPKVFDWVTARADCSLATQFLLLSEVVKSDVDTAIARGVGGEGVTYRCDQPTATKIIVIRETPRQRDFTGVVFEHTEDAIVITGRGHGNQTVWTMTASPTLTPDDGGCRFTVTGDGRGVISGDQLEAWQVSAEALTSLFFHGKP